MDETKKEEGKETENKKEDEERGEKKIEEKGQVNWGIDDRPLSPMALPVEELEDEGKSIEEVVAERHSKGLDAVEEEVVQEQIDSSPSPQTEKKKW